MTSTTHTTIRKPGHVFADELAVGSRIHLPGRKRPVTIAYQMGDDGDYFSFVGERAGGRCPIVLHRSAQVLPA